MNAPDPIEQAQRLQAAFFALPNVYRRSPEENVDTRDQRTMAALDPALCWYVRGKTDRPVLLPCRFVGEGLTTWYACVPSDAMARALRSELQAFIGPSYADFGTAGHDFSATDAHFMPMIEALGWRVVRFRAFRSAHEEKIVQLWQTYYGLLGRRPEAVPYVPKTFDQLRAAFDRALSTRDEPTARVALVSLREHHGLTAENSVFLDIRLAAAFERWEEITHHRLLPSLLSLHLPPETYGDVLEALYETYLRHYERAPFLDTLLQEFTKTLLANAMPLFRSRRTSRRPAVLKAFLLHELSQPQPDAAVCNGLLDSIRLGAFGSLDEAVRQRIASLTSRIGFADAQAALNCEQFDRAYDLMWPLSDGVELLRALLRCAREAEDPEKAQAVVLRIGSAPINFQKAVHEASPKTWERVQMLAAAHIEALQSWIGQLAWQAEQGESADAYVARWRELARAADPAELAAEPGLHEAAATYLVQLALEHPSVFDRVYPLWHELFVERAGPQLGFISVYQALLETLRMRDVYGDSELMLLRDTMLCLVHAGADAGQYRHAVEEMQAIFDEVRSPHAMAWALDICDGLSIAPARDPDARLRLLTSVVQAGSEFHSRLGPVQRQLLYMLAQEAGVTLQQHEQSPTSAASLRPSLRVALYSLDTEALRRASLLMCALYPSLKVECNSDEVCTAQLKALAQRAEIFVFAWKSSKHSAFYCIKDAVRDKSYLVMAAGAGTTSLVQAASSALEACP